MFHIRKSSIFPYLALSPVHTITQNQAHAQNWQGLAGQAIFALAVNALGRMLLRDLLPRYGATGRRPCLLPRHGLTPRPFRSISESQPSYTNGGTHARARRTPASPQKKPFAPRVEGFSPFQAPFASKDEGLLSEEAEKAVACCACTACTVCR
jgi:hypothetical protein